MTPETLADAILAALQGGDAIDCGIETNAAASSTIGATGVIGLELADGSRWFVTIEAA